MMNITHLTPTDQTADRVAEPDVPYKPLIPNAETIAAIEEARKGGLPRFESVRALMDALNAGD